MRNLKDIVAVTVLKNGTATSATTATGLIKAWPALPRRVMAVFNIISGAAAHTLAVTVEGSNDGGTTWSAALVTIAATDTAAASTQFADLGQQQYLAYRGKVVSAGAFGAAQALVYDLMLVGADPRNMPLTQV